MPIPGQPLEKSPVISPLLGEPVIVRDYTQGIEKQLGEPGQSKIINDEAKDTSQQNQNFSQPPPPPGQGPNQFSFNRDIDDTTDATDDDPSGMNLAAGSAKAFANVVGDIIKVKVPEICNAFVKIDLNSIETHIINGNINENLRDIFKQINIDTREGLEFSEDEIKMWKKAFKEYLEYKNIAVANPETAFWLATGVLITTQTIKVRELSKKNQQYIVDAINSYNPGYFDSFRAKMNKEPEKETPSQEKKEKKETKDKNDKNAL
jgi:hypothetical protein